MGTFPSIFSMGPNSHIRAHKKDSELMEVGSVFNNCFNVNFLMIPVCYCHFWRANVRIKLEEMS